MYYNHNIGITLIWLFLILNCTVHAQCTEAKDNDMAKYRQLTESGDAQGCSQCAALAMYLCSAKYCSTAQDKNQVNNMINACKKNIQAMGQPYCCADLMYKEPQWGILAGTATQNPSNSNNNYNQQSYNNTPTPANNDAADIINTAAGVIDILSGGESYSGNDAENVLNATTNILQGLSDIKGGNTNTNPLNSYGGYSTGTTNSNTTNTEEAVNYINQVVTELGNTGSYSPDAVTGATDIIGGVGSILSLLDEADAQAEQNRQAELQRQRQMEAIRQREEAERREKLRIINNRKAVINNIPEAKMPLTYPTLNSNEIYFFGFYCTSSSLESNNPEIAISNVFTVNKYSDGSWPLLNRLTDKIVNSTKIIGLKLTGYFTSRIESETFRNNLIKQAKSAGINVTGIQYSEKGAAGNSSSSANSDFWETGYKKKNIPVNSGTTTQEKTTKPALDFWENPVNQ